MARSPMRTGRGPTGPTQVARDDVIMHFRDTLNPAIPPFFIRVASQSGHARAEEMLRELKSVLREGVEVWAEIEPSRFAPRD